MQTTETRQSARRLLCGLSLVGLLFLPGILGCGSKEEKVETSGGDVYYEGKLKPKTERLGPGVKGGN